MDDRMDDGLLVGKPNIVFINLEIQTHLPWLEFGGGGGDMKYFSLGV